MNFHIETTNYAIKDEPDIYMVTFYIPQLDVSMIYGLQEAIRESGGMQIGFKTNDLLLISETFYSDDAIYQVLIQQALQPRTSQK